MQKSWLIKIAQILLGLLTSSHTQGETKCVGMMPRTAELYFIYVHNPSRPIILTPQYKLWGEPLFHGC